MREVICGIALATALAAAAPAQAAEIRFSCGFQELEVQLCEEAAQAWSAESGHQVTVIRGPERSNERYFEYLDLLSRSDPDLDVLQIDVIWPSAFADQLVDLSRSGAGRGPGAVFPERWSPTTRSTAGSWRCPGSPMPASSTTARICWRSMASRSQRPGPSWPMPRS